MKANQILRPVALSLVVFAAACSAGPPPQEIARARLAIQDAKSANADQRAARDYDAAVAHFNVAQNTWNEKKDGPTAAHWGRLAEAEARHAQARAELGAAEEDRDITLDHLLVRAASAFGAEARDVTLRLPFHDLRDLCRIIGRGADLLVFRRVRDETGRRIELYANRAAGEHLLRRWIDESIQPVLDQHEAMLQTSIQRTAGAIREAIVIRLEALLDQGPAKSVTHIDEEGSAVLLELRRSIDGLARDIEAFTDEIPERASAQLLQSGQTTDARSVIISIAEQRLDDARMTLMRRQRETKNRIRELCASAGLSPELLLLAESAQELQHLPLLDLTATLPDIDVRPPMFGGPARLTKILDRRFGGPLRDALRTYANRLHDWAIRSLDRTQTSFASVIDGTRGGASARDVDLTTLREDLRTLAEMTAAREYA